MATPCRKWRGVPFTEPTYGQIAYRNQLYFAKTTKEIKSI